ncbi:ribbon-helix-helix domain-containing protein [Priestia aryabhattai]|uniref:ribbon-helix-helix domain-containing protein n=1 Tax=Priestia aryabhattai TaxID=412384 RepID=UPI003D2E1CE1
MGMKSNAKKELEKASKGTQRESNFNKVATPSTGTEPSTPTSRYEVGTKVKNKQASVYLDMDVLEEIDRLCRETGKPKSHFINEMLVEYFGLQKRSNSIIISE